MRVRIGRKPTYSERVSIRFDSIRLDASFGFLFWGNESQKWSQPQCKSTIESGWNQKSLCNNFRLGRVGLVVRIHRVIGLQ